MHHPPSVYKTIYLYHKKHPYNKNRNDVDILVKQQENLGRNTFPSWWGRAEREEYPLGSSRLQRIVFEDDHRANPWQSAERPPHRALTTRCLHVGQPRQEGWWHEGLPLPHIRLFADNRQQFYRLGRHWWHRLVYILDQAYRQALALPHADLVSPLHLHHWNRLPM